MGATHFIGVEQVMSAYSARGIDVWAVVHGREILCAGENETDLREYLDLLSKSDGNTAAYTLRVFADIDDPNRITAKTEPNGSFKFELQGRGAVGGPVRSGHTGIDAISAKVNSIVADRVGAIIDEEFFKPKKPEKRKIGDILMEYLEDPEALVSVINAVKGLVSGQTVPAMAAISGIRTPVQRVGASQPAPVEQPAAVTGVVRTEDEQIELGNRLAKAINILDEADPKIVEHLEKLASLSQKNPALFEMLIANLDGIS